MPGTLWLIPTTLGGACATAVLPAGTMERVFALDFFLAEDPKSARAFLKLAGYPSPLANTRIELLDKDTATADLERHIATIQAGTDAGVLSEAGCPAIADPGAHLVRLAHARGVRVVPLTGPSSIALALMASGLNGQHFEFHGYLPVKAPERVQSIRALETRSRQDGGTQIFIETPYRNRAMFDALLQTCRADTQLCVACNLTLEDEFVATQPIRAWRGNPPDLDKKPAVFLLLAQLESPR